MAIKIKKKNRGKFTKWAKRNGFKSVQEAARHVMANKDKYSSSVVKMANFALNASKWDKKEHGGWAKTPMDYKMGLLAGKNKFKMQSNGPHLFTTVPMGIPIQHPIAYQGWQDGGLVDSGIAYPGENFTVMGNEIKEYPIYQKGGNVTGAQLIRAYKDLVLPGEFGMIQQLAGPGRSSLDPSTMGAISRAEYDMYKGIRDSGFDFIRRGRSKASPAALDSLDNYARASFDRGMTNDFNWVLDNMNRRYLRSAGLGSGMFKEVKPDFKTAVKAKKQSIGYDPTFYSSERMPADAAIILNRFANPILKEQYRKDRDPVSKKEKTKRRYKKGGKTPKYQKGDTTAPNPFAWNDPYLPRTSNQTTGLNVGYPLSAVNANSYAPYNQYDPSTAQFGRNPVPRVASGDGSYFSSPFFDPTNTGITSKDRPNLFSSLFGKTKKASSKSKDPNKGRFSPYKLNWSDIPLSSALYNVAGIMRGPEKESPYYNYQAQKALSELDSMRYMPNYRPLRLAQNRMERNLRDRAITPQMMSALRLQGTSNLQSKMRDTDLQAQNINNQYRQAYAQALMQEGARRAAERARVADRNLQHQAAWRQHAMTLAQGADQMMKNRRLLNQARIQDQMQIAGINAQTPDYHMNLDRYGDLQYYFRRPGTSEFVPMRRRLS